MKDHPVPQPFDDVARSGDVNEDRVGGDEAPEGCLVRRVDAVLEGGDRGHLVFPIMPLASQSTASCCAAVMYLPFATSSLPFWL